MSISRDGHYAYRRPWVQEVQRVSEDPNENLLGHFLRCKCVTCDQYGYLCMVWYAYGMYDMDSMVPSIVPIRGLCIYARSMRGRYFSNLEVFQEV